MIIRRPVNKPRWFGFNNNIVTSIKRRDLEIENKLQLKRRSLNVYKETHK